MTQNKPLEWCFEKGTKLKLLCGGEIVAGKINDLEDVVNVYGENKAFVGHWLKTGQFYNDHSSTPLDIIEVIPPSKPRSGTVWVNVYPSQEISKVAFGYETRGEADAMSGEDRIACIEVPWTEGEGLE